MTVPGLKPTGYVACARAALGSAPRRAALVWPSCRTGPARPARPWRR